MMVTPQRVARPGLVVSERPTGVPRCGETMFVAIASRSEATTDDLDLQRDPAVGRRHE